MLEQFAASGAGQGSVKRFHGRQIVITGAGRGLGFAYAQRLGLEGASVVIAEIDVQAGEQAERMLREKGVQATFVHTDVTSEESVGAMAEQVTSMGAGIHGLVANAGWANGVGGRRYDELTVEDWDRMMAINVRGVWLSVKAIGPRMQDGGAVVTISSGTVFEGPAALLHYVTSKAAIVGMTRCLARELGERGIRVNCVAPGLTVVEATHGLPQERWQYFNERRVLKRQQYPSDIEGLVAFLLSEESQFMTGQLLAIDGGASFH